MKNHYLFAAILSAAFFLGSSCAQPVPARTEFVLGTVCTVNLFEKGTEKAYREIFARLYELESILSANRDDTNLAEINANSGLTPVKGANETLLILKEALVFSAKTDGAFDPTVGPLVKAWNIGTDNAAVPEPAVLAQALSLIDYTKVVLDEKAGTVFLTEKGMKLDLGAIAKGYAADEIVRIVTEHKIRKAIIDLGGNVYAFGEKSPGKSWTIGVRDPENNTGESILSLPVANKSVVTSGVYERFFEQDGVKYHHILDTETGYPVQNDLLSVTIITGKSMQADALSTSVFVLGAKKGKALVESLPDTDAIFVFRDRHIEATGELPGQLRLLTTKYTLTQ